MSEDYFDAGDGHTYLDQRLRELYGHRKSCGNPCDVCARMDEHYSIIHTAIDDLLNACKMALRTVEAEARILPGSAYHQMLKKAIAKAEKGG